MTPSAAAIKLFNAWSFGLQEEDIFPIDARKLAEGLGISVVGEKINDDFQGCLYISDGVKAIIYNESIDSPGRKNYTVAHELGHYCLHRNRGDLQCSLDDINNIGEGAPHEENIEREANRFAANLLMPGKYVSQQIKGQTPSIGLAETLSNRFGTSLLASAYRLVELTSREAVLVVLSADNRVISSWVNRKCSHMYVKKGLFIDAELKTDKFPRKCDGDIWFDREDLATDPGLRLSVLDFYEFGKLVILTRERSY